MVSLLWLLRAGAILIGTAHAAISIHDHMMNEDGISYLDLGDRYARGELRPLNSVWSPLYPFVLGTAVRLFEPPARWEFAVAHLVTLMLFVVALASFEFFWRTLWRALRAGSPPDTATVTFSERAWWVSGYALVVWSSVVLIRFRAVTPDMLVAALTYLAAGLLVRSGFAKGPRAVYAMFGFVLGAGYLAKAAMFPLAFVFLIAAAGVAWHRPERRRAWLLAPITFALVAAPFVLALSMAKGEFTFGDAGRFTYLKHVNGLRFPYEPAAIPAGLGVPVHPIRQVHTHPTVLEFAAPVPGTYPPGYDPSFWVQGLAPDVQPLRQARDLVKNLGIYGDLFVRQLGGPLAVIVLLLWMGGRVPLRASWSAGWPVALMGVALAALGMYALVYVEGRYIAPFVVMLCGAVMALVRVPDSPVARRAIGVAGVLLPSLVLVELAAFDAPYARRFLSPGRLAWELQAGTRRPDAPWRIAEALNRLGVEHGDPVGFIGYSFGATFARLARVRIVAEMSWEEAPKFWQLDADGRARVLQSFADSGAVAVITEVPPPKSSAHEWTELEGSGRYARLLRDGS